MNCISCEDDFGEGQYEEIIYLEKCDHQVCKKCLEERIIDNYPEVHCPDENCKGQILEPEMDSVLGKERFNQLQTDMVNKVIEGDKGVVVCPCGNAIEVIPEDKVNYAAKKEDGTGITKTAAKHMSQNRIRCNECEKNFCRKCMVEPYHIGATCAQHEKQKNQRKCKFCQCNIRGNKVVCTKRRCKYQMGQCCATLLECGHACAGQNWEPQHPPCLHEDCVKKDEGPTLGENVDSFCSICYTEGLGEKPVVALGCKHIFHANCL
jgi:hypothetical protein